MSSCEPGCPPQQPGPAGPRGPAGPQGPPGPTGAPGSSTLDEPFAGSGIVSLTEFSLTTGSAGVASQTLEGVYSVFIDVDEMAAGDQYQVRAYEKVDSPAAPQRRILSNVMTGDQPALYHGASFHLIHGWDFTIQKLVGTDRTFRWSIRRIA